MSYGQPARASAHPARSTEPAGYGPRKVYRVRRRRALLVAALAVAAAYAGFGAASPLLDSKTQFPTGRGGTYVSAPHQTGGSSVRWPSEGQAALVLGNGRPAASPHEQSVPIASLAKVMTAYLTLLRYPLSGAQDGFTINVSAADARAAAEDRAEGQSVVAVAAGERLTERQLLEALLVPSGNNIADMLGARVAGSQTRFVAEMNVAARGLGMGHTTYTDPSGFDSSTVSTAADQLRVLRAAMRFSVFRQIVSMGSVTLPVAGTVTNFNPLIAEGYAGKTGSDSAAGGCLAFFTDVTVGGHRRTAAGVVLRQGEGSNTTDLLAAAGEAAERLVNSAVPTTRRRVIPAPGRTGRRRGGGRRGRPPLSTTGGRPAAELTLHAITTLGRNG